MAWSCFPPHPSRVGITHELGAAKPCGDQGLRKDPSTGLAKPVDAQARAQGWRKHWPVATTAWALVAMAYRQTLNRKCGLKAAWMLGM